MPVIQSTETTPPVEQPNPVEVARPEYKGVAVDTRYIPKTSLLTHVEGASWTVVYYSQVLDSDNALSGQNMDRDPSLQQYKRITQFELKVTTSLTQTQDETTKQFTLTGQANVYPGTIIPNEGDMFLADIGDGREGVFQITSSLRNTIYKDAAFTINYSLTAYSDEQRVGDLNQKTIERLTYVSDFLIHGQNPLLVESDVVLLNSLNQSFEEMVDYYFARYFSKEYRTLVIPGQTDPCYDPFLTHAVLGSFTSQASVNYKFIRELNVGGMEAYSLSTIWDAIRLKRRSILRGAPTQMKLISARYFSIDAMQESIRFSGMRYVQYPANGVQTEDSYMLDSVSPSSTLVLTGSRINDLNTLIALTSQNGLTDNGQAVININAQSEFYVLSQAFYNNASTGQSSLELQVQRYLNDQALDMSVLFSLSQTYRSWGLLEQFYQIPVLLMMIRAAVRRM